MRQSLTKLSPGFVDVEGVRARRSEAAATAALMATTDIYKEGGGGRGVMHDRAAGIGQGRDGENLGFDHRKRLLLLQFCK